MTIVLFEIKNENVTESVSLEVVNTSVPKF